jgi:hypothetical protein
MMLCGRAGTVAATIASPHPVLSASTGTRRPSPAAEQQEVSKHKFRMDETGAGNPADNGGFSLAPSRRLPMQADDSRQATGCKRPQTCQDCPGRCISARGDGLPDWPAGTKWLSPCPQWPLSSAPRPVCRASCEVPGVYARRPQRPLYPKAVANALREGRVRKNEPRH